MAVYFVTGKLGAGKSLVAVSRIVDYLSRGRPVATNLDLFFDRFHSNPWAKNIISYRLPDHPTAEDIKNIGDGNKTYDEALNGLIVFDECGRWFNSRDWNQPGRREFINELVLLRKRGWDVLFLVQHYDLVDTQARNALGEHVVYCRRLDRLAIPGLTMLTKLILGFPLRLPRAHLGIVKYGDSQHSLTVDRWFYRGNDLFDFYDTRQIFSADYPHGLYQYLPPYHIKGRYITKGQFLKERYHDFIYKCKSFRRSLHGFFVAGMLGGFIVSTVSLSSASTELSDVPATKESIILSSDPFSDWNYYGYFCNGPDDCQYFFQDSSGKPIDTDAWAITWEGGKLRVTDGQTVRYFNE